MVKADAVPFGQAPLRLVIRDDGYDVDGEIAGGPAVEQIVEAMAALRHRDDEARLGGAVADPRVHRETLDDGREGSLHRRPPLGQARAGAAKFDAHEEAAGIRVGIILAYEDETVRQTCRGNG